MNSALQRARAAAQDRLPEQSQQVTLHALGGTRVMALAERYADAIEAGRTDVLVSMVTADITWAMPPLRTWYHELPGRHHVPGGPRLPRALAARDRERERAARCRLLHV